MGAEKEANLLSHLKDFSWTYHRPLAETAEDAELKPQTRLLVLLLATQGTDGISRVSQKRIAKVMGNSQQTVSRLLIGLCDISRPLVARVREGHATYYMLDPRRFYRGRGAAANARIKRFLALSGADEKTFEERVKVIQQKRYEEKYPFDQRIEESPGGSGGKVAVVIDTRDGEEFAEYAPEVIGSKLVLLTREELWERYGPERPGIDAGPTPGYTEPALVESEAADGE
jgi:transcriptional regulator with XRE-family HTH domain